MPKFVSSLGADDRFNLMLGLIAYLTKNPSCEVSELETIFKVEKKQIIQTLHLINTGGYFPAGGIDTYPFWIDADLLESEELVEFSVTEDTPGAPRISQSQAAALAAGLIYLKSMPQYANDLALASLQEKLSRLEAPTLAPMIDIKPGSLDAELALVVEAINSRRPIRMEYINRAGESSSREIEPVKLVESDGHQAVLSWCRKTKEQRNFRVDRMSKLSILAEQISPEASEMFENLDSLPDDAYNPGEFDHDVVVEVTPEAYSLVSQFVLLKEPTKTGDDTLRVTIKVGRLEQLGKLIAKYGGAAKVIEPKLAREIVRDYALVALGKSPLANQELSVE